MGDKKHNTYYRWGRILGHRNFNREDFKDVTTCPICSKLKEKKTEELHVREIMHMERHIKKLS